MQNMTYRPAARLRVNTKPPAVTLAFIALNVLAFVLDRGLGLIQYGSLDQGPLTVWGLRYNPAIVLGNQWWRLLTAAFLHGSISHLFFNCMGTYIWGRFVESFYGRWRTAAILIVSAIVGNAAGLAFSNYPALGFSGAVFGLLGALLAFYRYDKELFTRIFGLSVLVYAGYSLVSGFISSGVDNWGHMGGLIGGFLIGRALGILGQPRRDATNYLSGVGLLLLVALLIAKGIYWPKLG